MIVVIVRCSRCDYEWNTNRTEAPCPTSCPDCGGEIYIAAMYNPRAVEKINLWPERGTTSEPPPERG